MTQSVRRDWERRSFLRAIPFLLGPIGSSSAAAQVQQPPRFRSEAAQVLVPFTAEDKHHHLVPGLKAEDMRLLVDGREQPISFLSVEDGPVSVVFVLDISGSMKKPVTDVQEAMRRILRAADSSDEFAVVEFNDTPELTVDFTARPERIEQRIEGLMPGGRTSLTDGIVMGLRELRRARQPRRALIVLSDGAENHSRHVRTEALRTAVEADVRVYAIELYPPIGESFGGPTMLELLARATGGRYLPTVNRKNIPDLVERIDIHRGYVLGFNPPMEQRDGKLHQVSLKLRRKTAGERVRLFWKERYRVPSAL